MGAPESGFNPTTVLVLGPGAPEGCCITNLLNTGSRESSETGRLIGRFSTT